MTRLDELKATRSQEEAAQQPLPTRLDSLKGTPQPTPARPVTRLDQLKMGYTPETSPYIPAQARQSIFAAGIDAGQGNFQSGFAELLGLADLDQASDYLKKMSEKNMLDASVDREGLWDDVKFAAGQAVPSIGGAVAGAVLAPYVGLSASVGAGLAGFATSWGMNAGDFFAKERAEDPNYEIGVKDLGVPTAMASLDLIPGVGGVAMARKILRPVADAVADTVVQTAVNQGVKSVASDFAKKIAKVSAGQAAIEGSQDFMGSIGAALMTDSELSEAKINSFANTAAYEALIGGILGVPLGGVASISDQLAIAETKYNATRTTPTTVNIQNINGDLSNEFKDIGLVTGAVKQPGMLSLGLTTLMGNSTDVLKKKFAGSGKMRALLNTFAVDRRDRAPGHLTHNEKSRGLEGEMQAVLTPFNQASAQEQTEALRRKAEGIAPSTPVELSLHKFLNELTLSVYDEATRGRGKDITQGLFADPTYIPTNNLLDWEAMSKKADLLASARADMEARLVKPEAIEATLLSLQDMLNSYQQTGDALMTKKLREQSVVQEKLYSHIKTLQASGQPLTKKTKEVFKSRVMKEAKSTTRQGVLTLDRSLSHLSNDWMFKNARQGKHVARDTINAHARQVAEQAALIDAFGIDNKVFDEAVIDIALDQLEAGQPLDAADVNHLYDILRTQQRIHLNPFKNATLRKVQNQARAVMNMKLLGLSALVSIPESLTIFLNTGGKATLQGLAQTVLKGASPVGMGLASEQLGYTINNAVRGTINRTGEESYEVGAMEQAFFRWTLLPYLQHFLTVWAARANDVHIRKMLTDLNNKPMSEAQRFYHIRKLEEAGLNVEQAQNWAANNFDESSAYFKQSYIPALIGLTHDTIVDPHPIDKPLWMNDERFLLLSQLKGFMTVFTNKIMRGWRHQASGSVEGKIGLATKIAPYIAMYLAAQVAMQAVREVMKNGDLDKWDEKEIEERVVAAFGYLGAMGYLVDTYHSYTWNSDPLVNNLGPVPATAVKTVGGVIQALETMDADKTMDKFLKSSMPNTPFSGLALEALGVE